MKYQEVKNKPFIDEDGPAAQPERVRIEEKMNLVAVGAAHA